ncbi:hypothetical protein Aduo_009184 [Ancylostoma duodenale]
MTSVGQLKASLTKAANHLRLKKSEVDLSILSEFAPIGDSDEVRSLIFNREYSLINALASLKRVLNALKERWEHAEKYAEEHPGEDSDHPLIEMLQLHWDSLEADSLVDEVEELLIKLKTSLSLLLPVESKAYHSFNPSHAPPYSALVHKGCRDSIELRSKNNALNYEKESSCAQNVTNTQCYSSLLNPMFLSNKALVLPHEQQIKLPRFELPDFDGSVDAFFESWDLYCAAIPYNNSVPPALKFLYLKTYVKVSASHLIANFHPTAENYEESVCIITNTNNRPDVLRNKLWDKLVAHPKSSNSPLPQRITLCGIKAIRAQMKKTFEASGCDRDSQDNTIQISRSYRLES